MIDMKYQLRCYRDDDVATWLGGARPDGKPRWPGDDGRALKFSERDLWKPEVRAAQQAYFEERDAVYEKAKAETPAKIAAYDVLHDAAVALLDSVGWDGHQGSVDKAFVAAQDAATGIGGMTRFRDLQDKVTEKMTAYHAGRVEAAKAAVLEKRDNASYTEFVNIAAEAVYFAGIGHVAIGEVEAAREADARAADAKASAALLASPPIQPDSTSTVATDTPAPVPSVAA